MNRALGTACLLSLLAGLLPADAAAAPALDAFSAACEGNPGFFSIAVEGLETQPEAHTSLCTCLAGRFAAFPEADLVMLTKDVDGTATAEDRAAYGDYTALELKALDALQVCVTEAGLEEVTDSSTAPADLADMTRFDASCLASEGLLEVIGGAVESATPLRSLLCGCLSERLAPLVTTADAVVLGQDLDGTATDASRGAHAGYEALTETAGAVFQLCFSALPVPGAP